MGSFEKNNDDYLLCRSILEEGSKTFYFASKKLPQEKRKGFWAVYAFCRKTDDIIDEGTDCIKQRQKNLSNWKRALLRAYEGKRSQNGIIRAFVATMRKYRIPLRMPLKLIDGVATDAKKVAFESFGSLKNYCFSVASVVGLMLLYVMGSNIQKAAGYAVSLGIAMQLTNIIRDIREDAQMGRFYLPKSELSRFGLKHEDLLSKLAGYKLTQLKKFLKFQIKRARVYYQKAMGGIRYLPKELQFPITLAAHLYQKILEKVEQNGYDIAIRAFVPFHEKIFHYIRISFFGAIPRMQCSLV